MIIIVEKHINDACDRLAAAAKGMPDCEVIEWEDGDPIPTEADFFFGSLTTCSVMPGVIGDPEKLKVSHWLPLVKDIALNTEVVTGTVEDMPDVPWERIFVRPDSCMKPFSGRVLDKAALSPESLDFGFYFDNIKLPICISPVQEVGEEWRFVAIHGHLVTYSGYTADRDALDTKAPAGAILVAEEAIRRSPEPSVVIDICQLVDGSFKLVEYNLLSGADLYDCDVATLLWILLWGKARMCDW